METAKELLGLISNFIENSKIMDRLSYPINEEYLKLLHVNILKSWDIYEDPDIEDENYDKDVYIKVDVVVKGTIFLYLMEILDWSEVKYILNIEENDDIIPPLIGSYEIIMSLLSVFFGKVVFIKEIQDSSYKFTRYTTDAQYWNQPTYYYGHKSILSYNSLDDLLNNIDWYLDSFPESGTIYKDHIDRNDVLGMIRVNDKYSRDIMIENGIDMTDVRTELNSLGEYNISLNVVEPSSTNSGLGLNNMAFEFYKSILADEARYIDRSSQEFAVINFDEIRKVCKYVDTIYRMIEDDNYWKVVVREARVIRGLQNFLLN